MNLTEKQNRFCEEYVVDFNGTQAAIRAGYSKSTANRIASQNLSKLDIQSKIKTLIEARQERTGIEADKVLKEVYAMAMAKITDVVELSEGIITIKNTSDLSDAVKSAIQEVSSSNGVIKIKMHSKDTALEKLMKHLGLYEVDNKQKSTTINLDWSS